MSNEHCKKEYQTEEQVTCNSHFHGAAKWKRMERTMWFNYRLGLHDEREENQLNGVQQMSKES